MDPFPHFIPDRNPPNSRAVSMHGVHTTHPAPADGAAPRRTLVMANVWHAWPTSTRLLAPVPCPPAPTQPLLAARLPPVTCTVVLPGRTVQYLLYCMYPRHRCPSAASPPTETSHAAPSSLSNESPPPPPPPPRAEHPIHAVPAPASPAFAFLPCGMHDNVFHTVQYTAHVICPYRHGSLHPSVAHPVGTREGAAPLRRRYCAASRRRPKPCLASPPPAQWPPRPPLCARPAPPRFAFLALASQ